MSTYTRVSAVIRQQGVNVLTPQDFKPAGEPDFYRTEWELLVNDNDDPFEMKIGASSVMLATPSQVRRILVMLSAEEVPE